MEVASVNIGERKKITWKGKPVETGIFKSPVAEISLGKTDVEKDQVVDRKYHGGVDKACYLYSCDVYPFWKEKYPHLDWRWGMFGENITVAGLNESDVTIGSVYALGSAVVEVSEPRQPCFKLGIRFGTQHILKEFIEAGHSGVYMRVLKPGVVKPGDKMLLQEKRSDISIRDIFQLLYQSHENPALLTEAIGLPYLAESTRRDLVRARST